MVDKGDLGTIVGGGIGGAAAVLTGLGPIGIVVAATAGAYIGHNLTEQSHYSPKHSYK